MRNLSHYIIENQQLSINEYIIDEGFLDWLKKAWNWVTNKINDNSKKYNGKYTISDSTYDDLNDNDKKKKLVFLPLDNEDEFVKKLQYDTLFGKNCEFSDVIKYVKKTKEFAYCITLNKVGPIGFQFGEYNEDDKTFKPTKLFWGKSQEDNELDDSFKKYYIAQLKEWLKKKDIKLIENENTN